MRIEFNHFNRFVTIICLAICIPYSNVRAQVQKPEPSYGFYKGVFYFSMIGGETSYAGGSLIQREKDYQNGLRSQAILGILPVRMVGTVPFPQSFPLPTDKIQSGNTRRVSMEYGLTDNLGFFISYNTIAIESQGTNQLAVIDRNQPNGYTTYIEAIPLSATLYKDRSYGLGLNYHFLSKNRFDPYVGLEVSVLNFDTKYRSGQLNNLYYPTYTHPGTGYGGRVAFGTNYFITPEFGIAIEIYGSRKILKSNAFESESINHAGFQFGFIFNFESMGRL